MSVSRPLQCLLDVFASLPSSRAARGTIYPLDSIVALALIAILSGCKNHPQIAAFARVRPRLLKKLGFRPPKYPRRADSKGKIRAPSKDTIPRILATISPQDFNEGLACFLSRIVKRGAQAAIDGKALRGAHDYVLSVFVNDICQVVWQEDVGRKENELSCLERSISDILSRYPNLRLFTGDAAFCHKSIARSLIEAKRDYFLQLKAPHTTDVALAEDAFDQLRATEPLATTAEKRGAREGRKS
ncbi:ISAs1 family transposase [bacterium]|nr:ISAs1 family transposase [bacterium]